MRPHKRFYKIQQSASYRFNKLRNLAAITLRNSNESLLSYIVLETLNTWNNFSRSYYLSCTKQPKNTRGVLVTITLVILDDNDAIGAAIRRLRPPYIAPSSTGAWHRRDEPAWHDKNNLLNACHNIGCSNFSDIQAAFSFGSRVFADLVVFRNFYAHRNQMTEQAAMNLGPQYGIPATLRPSKILQSRAIGRPQPLLLDMIDDLIATVELLCY